MGKNVPKGGFEIRVGSSKDHERGNTGECKRNEVKDRGPSMGKEKEKAGERGVRIEAPLSREKDLSTQGASSSEPSDGAGGQPSAPQLVLEDSTQTETSGAVEFTPASTGVKRGRDSLSSGSGQPLREKVAAAERKRLLDGAEELYVLSRTNLKRHLLADEFQQIMRDLESRVFCLEGEF